jgi:predicted peroxiredoxin
MEARRRMVLVLVSDGDERLGEAAAFAASGAAMGFAVHLLLTGPALARAVAGRLPGDAAARVAEAREAGDVRLYGCSAALRRLGLATEAVVGPGASGLPLDAVVGIPAFLEHLAGAEVQLVF